MADVVVNSSAEDQNDLCLVCNAPTKGLHLQVTACRACASFYRRSIKAKKRYRCQRGVGQCSLNKSTNHKKLCRYCRMIKCEAIGMKIDAERLSPMPYNNSSIPPLPSLQEESHFVPSVASAFELQLVNKKWTINWEPIVAKIKHALQQETNLIPQLPKGVKFTEMQRFQFGLTRILQHTTPKSTVKIVSSHEVDRIPVFQFYENYIIYIVQLLQSLECFSKLPFDTRWIIFKRFWHNFQMVERAFTSCEHLGDQQSDSIIFIDNTTAMDIVNDCFTVIDLTPEQHKQFCEIHRPMTEAFVSQIIVPLKRLRISQTELCYLGMLILWNSKDLCNLPSTWTDIANEELDKASHELHLHYTYEKRTPNYANRVMLITRIAAEIQRQAKEKQEIATMASIFNLFQFDVNCGEIIE